MAALKDGVLDTAIKVPDELKGKGVGKKLFRDAIENIGPGNVRTIRGNWIAGDTMADNFNSFKRAVPRSRLRTLLGALLLERWQENADLPT